MKKPIYIFAWFLAILIFSCGKASNQATENNSSLLGRWILVETLADPGDGSGKWTAVDKPNYYYLQLNADSTVETNYLTGLGGARSFTLVNDSAISFTYGNGQTIKNGYRNDNSSLTLTGGCIEACGAKFARGNQR
jgi:hypothetical protein